MNWYSPLKDIANNTKTEINDQMFVLLGLGGLCRTFLYLVLRIGGVHDAAQLPACVNHNPHHCALREAEEKMLQDHIKEHMKT